ncbi:putative permease [Alkalihalobacillus xiaoxiensis]|uniref:Permease n=1 Tax=Shouchella xiaoxiensis TaxID=766895 RepID=A0ABS2SPN6_9BACI|nr:AEC family transporter [Shouchella xiaoxiensis]MBM7837484.1 putative permease [Shouchella xiaoxiensis]
MTIFYQVVLPVFLVFTAGFVVQRALMLDIRSISSIAIYIMTPCLVFRTFYLSPLDSDYLYMVVFALLLMFALIYLTKVYTKLRKIRVNEESGLILSTAFMNVGNYGTPIILFAYGQLAFELAVSFMVLQSIIMNVFGVYYAAKGKAPVSGAILAVFKMPATYATVIALLFNVFDIPVPSNLFLTIDMIAEAAIPTVMLILGMQLAMIQWKGFQWERISVALVIRMILSPILAYLILLFLPVDDLLRNVLIVSAAMPSAATIVMYAVKFDAEPRLVSTITLMTTLFSLGSITFIIWILG